MEDTAVTSSQENGVLRADLKMEPKEETETSCGWCNWRPRWLQKFNSRRWLLVSLSSAAFMMVMIEDGFTNSAITSIERRFQLRSQDIGIMISIYELTVILAMLPVTYFGGRGNKPRWISVGCFFIGLGSLCFALPHFTTERYSYFDSDVTDDSMCFSQGSNSSSVESCTGDGSSISTLSKYIILFGVAKVIAGIGTTPMSSLTLIFLDESITTKQNGIYLGVFFTMGTVGTAVGYLVAGVFLSIYTDIDMPPGVTASPSDPGWVGAWWLGFVIAGVVIIAISIPIGLFPPELPKTAKIRAQKPLESHKNSGVAALVFQNLDSNPQETEPSRLGQDIQGVLKILKHLAINPTYVFTVMSTIPDILLLNSFAAFLPKLFENQFMVTSSMATIITGIAVIPGAVIGTFLGGWIMQRWNLKVPGLIKLNIVGSIIKFITFFSVLLHCPQTQIAGVTVPYDVDYGSHALNLTSPCNEACLCSNDKFKPVCLEESGLTFFSPCHAGCSQDFGNDTYGDCSCSPWLNASIPSTIKDGKCLTECNYLIVFIILMNAALIAIFMATVPLMNIILRCVAEHERSVAIGMNSIAVRTFGSIPGPILFGMIIDSTCLQWQETCGVRGACWLYNNATLSWKLTVLSVICNLCTVCFYSLALRFYEPAPQKSPKNDEEVPETETCLQEKEEDDV